MAVDGTWNVTLNTPMGARPVTLVLEAAGASLTGTFGGAQGSTPVLDGKANGNDVEFNVDFVGQMGPMKLGFKGTVDGDALSGSVQFGGFGSGTFTGTRA